MAAAMILYWRRVIGLWSICSKVTVWLIAFSPDVPVVMCVLFV